MNKPGPGPSPKPSSKPPSKPASASGSRTPSKGSGSSNSNGNKKPGSGKASSPKLDAAGAQFLKNLKAEGWGEEFDTAELSTDAIEKEIKDLVVADTNQPNQELTLELILESHVADDQNLAKAPPQVRQQYFQGMTHVHLDRCRLASLPLEVLTQLPSTTHLYLQHNRLTSISTLASLKALQFLSVSHNRISQVEGLSSLKHLMFLDITCNNISSPKRSQFPESLRILKVDGNPFINTHDEGAAVLNDMLDGLPNLRELDVEEVEEEPDPLKDLEPVNPEADGSGQALSITHLEGALDLLEKVERSALHRSKLHVQMKTRASVDRLSTVVRGDDDGGSRPSSSHSHSSGRLGSATRPASGGRMAVGSSAAGPSPAPRPRSSSTVPSSSQAPGSAGKPLSRSNSRGESSSMRAPSPLSGRGSTGAEALHPSSSGGGERTDSLDHALACDYKMLEAAVSNMLEPSAGGSGPPLLGAQGFASHLESKREAIRERLKETREMEDSVARGIRKLQASQGNVSEMLTKLKKEGHANLKAPRPVSASKAPATATGASAPVPSPARAPSPLAPSPRAPSPRAHCPQLPPGPASCTPPRQPGTVGGLNPVQAPPGQTAAAIMAAVSAAEGAAARNGILLSELRSPHSRLERITSASNPTAGSGTSSPLAAAKKPLALPTTKPLFTPQAGSEDDGDDDDDDDFYVSAGDGPTFAFKKSLPPNPFAK